MYFNMIPDPFILICHVLTFRLVLACSLKTHHSKSLGQVNKLSFQKRAGHTLKFEGMSTDICLPLSCNVANMWKEWSINWVCLGTETSFPRSHWFSHGSKECESRYKGRSWEMPHIACFYGTLFLCSPLCEIKHHFYSLGFPLFLFRRRRDRERKSESFWFVYNEGFSQPLSDQRVSRPEKGNLRVAESLEVTWNIWQPCGNNLIIYSPFFLRPLFCSENRSVCRENRAKGKEGDDQIINRSRALINIISVKTAPFGREPLLQMRRLHAVFIFVFIPWNFLSVKV